nr:hypothetical protein [Escherichia coli]EEZ1797882.1 hypothetical protein [Escherichia coli]
MFHTIVSIKNDGHYFCRAGGNRPDGLNEPVTKNKDFSPDEIEKSANMNNGWLARALFGQKSSLAEHVYAEFERRGINVSISGYHGTGVFYVPEHGKPTTHLRSTTVPATPEHTVRRSDYRATLGRTQPIDIE